MRIAMIGQKGIPAQYGGVERHVEELSAKLVELGHDVTVYCRAHYSDRGQDSYRGVRMRFVPTIRSKHLDAIVHTLIATLDVIFRRDVDIVHYHGIGPSSLLIFVKIFSRDVRVVSTFHCQDYEHDKWGGFARTYLKFGEWVAHKFADRVIAVSEELVAYSALQYNTVAEYIPNGVVTQHMTLGESESVLGDYGLVAGKYILLVSRFTEFKRIEDLILAYRQVKSDAKLVLVGDASFESEYRRFLHELGSVDERIVFTGFQSGARLVALFRNAAGFVNPSHVEGLPLAVLEAGAYGLPVVATDLPAHREVLGEYGRYVAVNDIDALASEVSRVLKMSVLKRSEVGRSLQRRIGTKFSWNRIGKSTAELYDELLRVSEREGFDAVMAEMREARG